MTTKSLSSNVLRFPKLLTVAAALTFALSMGVSQTQAVAAAAATQTGLLTESQAKAAAQYILDVPAPLRYNAAITVAKDLTGNSGSAFAAANAKLIAKYLPESQQVALVPAILQGVSYNYPNQFPTIAGQLIFLNDTTLDHADRLIAQIAPLAGTTYSAQLAVALNIAIRQNKSVLKKTAFISVAIFAGINNSNVGTAAQRANAIAVAAGNLATGLLTPDKCGVVSKANKKAFDQISKLLTYFMESIPTGNLTREELVYNVVGNFTTTLKNSLPPGTSPAAANAILDLTQAAITQQLQQSGLNQQQMQELIQQLDAATNAAKNAPAKKPFVPVGPVNDPETRH